VRLAQLRRGECLGEQLRLIRPALVVEVAHCRVDVRVAHPRLHLHDARAVDRQRTEGVAQVVEAKRAQIRGGQGADVAAAEGRGVDVLADRAEGGRSRGASTAGRRTVISVKRDMVGGLDGFSRR
jgi:hypothetical protein